MARRGSAKDWRSIAPYLLVLAYAVLVASAPAIDLRQLASLGLDYLLLSARLLMLFVMLAFVVALARRITRGDTAQRPVLLAVELARQRWREDRCLSLVAPALLFVVLMTSFNAFKQAILPSAGFGLDATFAAWDRALFFGQDPWRITHDLLPGAWATLLVSLTYHQAFLPMVAGVFLCTIAPIHPALRTQYLLSYALIWVLVGTALAYLLPSAGPPFWGQFHGSPDPFAPLMERLGAYDLEVTAAGYQDGLSAYRFQRTLSLAFGTADLTLAHGISAMPSVHNALAVQFACAAFSIRRWLGWTASAYAVLIWIGSVHLGWHYAVDGIVAAAVTIPLWFACGRFARALSSGHAMTPPAVPQPNPA